MPDDDALQAIVARESFETAEMEFWTSVSGLQDQLVTFDSTVLEAGSVISKQLPDEPARVFFGVWLPGLPDPVYISILFLPGMN